MLWKATKKKEEWRKEMIVKKSVFVAIGFITLALGSVGIVVPIIPTVPFYLLAAYCFAHSSQRLHQWFLSTDLYKKHLESYVQKKGMLIKTKVSIIITVTLLMGFGVFMMARKQIWIPCIILGIVWIAHIVYFLFVVKTISEES